MVVSVCALLLGCRERRLPPSPNRPARGGGHTRWTTARWPHSPCRPQHADFSPFSLRGDQANGNLVKVLIHTDVTKYLEFKAVDGSFVLNKARVEKVGRGEGWPGRVPGVGGREGCRCMCQVLWGSLPITGSLGESCLTPGPLENPAHLRRHTPLDRLPPLPGACDGLGGHQVAAAGLFRETARGQIPGLRPAVRPRRSPDLQGRGPSPHLHGGA